MINFSGTLIERKKLMAKKKDRDMVSRFLILGFLVWFGLLPAAQAQTVGYEIPTGVVNYSNSGAVSAEETVGDDETLSEVTGVYSDHGLILFENTAEGSISALGQAGDAVTTDVYAEYIYGALLEGEVFDFINAGTITATAVAGDALNGNYSYVYYVAGAWFDDDAGSFTNTGTISASAEVGDAVGDYSYADVQGAKGVFFYYDMGDFTNEGTISASAVVGSAVGDYSDAYIYGTRGVHVYDGYVYGDFVNTGEISASAVVGSAVGDYSDAYIYGTRAIHLDEEVYGDFTNEGTISASTVVGSALGLSADVGINGTQGIHFDDDLYSNFINEGTISASAVAGDAAGDSSYASISGTRGIHFDDYVYGSFTNKGTISGISVVGDATGDGSSAYIYDAQGVRFDYYLYGGFANEGAINGSAVVGDATGDSSSVYVDGTRGVYVYYDVYGGFTNDGTISATAVAGDAAGASSYANIGGTRGIHFDDDVYGFSNAGTITSSDTVGSATGESSYVYIEGSRGVQFDDYLYGGFTNDGTISAATVAGDAAGTSSSAYIEGTRGVLLDSYVYGKFTNTGEISASATAGSATGDSSEVYVIGTRGVQFDYGLEGSFTNTGTIDAIAAAGDAAGNLSEVYVRGLHGVVFKYPVYKNFSNEGTITATAALGDASGNDSYAWAHHIFGVRLFDEIYGTFTNTGTISTSLTAGSASGENSTMEITDIYGVYLAAGAGSFDNQGDISVDVQAADNAMISPVAAVFVNNGGGFNDVPMRIEPSIMVTEPLPSDAGTIDNSGSISASVKAGAGSLLEAGGIVVVGDARINNTGDIFVSVDSPYEDSVARAAGIYLDGSTAEVSNSGAVYLFSNMGGDSDMRTLYAEYSNVTFVDSFSAIFGSPGIEDDPVYIDADSTLNINDADLIARAGNDLLLATPYGVIENDGTVEGEFANLTVGYTNPDITVNWADSAEKGENAAVVFGFEPQNNVGARSVNVGSALLSQRLNLFSNVLYGPGSSSELTADVNKKSVLYAQAGSSDAGPNVPLAYRYENGMYFLPYYSSLRDSGIGADADTYGFFLGYERILGNDFIAGVFGGYSRSDLDYTGVFNGNTEDQDTYSLGVNVVYDQPGWFGDFFANYNWISHEYAGRTGANFELPETADYDSKAFVSQIRAGYKHFLGYDAGLYPYVGLRSTYWSTDGYKTSVAHANWAKDYGSFSDTWFKGLLGVSADKTLQRTDDCTWRVYGGVGVERTLNDNDVVITQTLQGISASVKEEYSRTSWTGNMGVEYGKNNFSITFDVSGEKNSDYDVYGGLFKFKYQF
jgi:hypothetical protein